MVLTKKIISIAILRLISLTLVLTPSLLTAMPDEPAQDDLAASESPQQLTNFSLNFINRISYTKLSELRETIIPMMEAFGYTLVPIANSDPSQENMYIFYNADAKRLLITYRGTQNSNDVKTDFTIATNSLEDSQRYKNNYTTTTNTLFYPNNIENYPQDIEVWLFGHSLGGALASLIGFNLNKDKRGFLNPIHVVTYNKGAPLFGDKEKFNPNEIAHVTEGDIFSIGAHNDDNIQIHAISTEKANLLSRHDHRLSTAEIPFFPNVYTQGPALPASINPEEETPSTIQRLPSSNPTPPVLFKRISSEREDREKRRYAAFKERLESLKNGQQENNHPNENKETNDNEEI